MKNHTKPFVGKLIFSSPINKENSFGAWNLSEETESEIDFTIREDGTGFFEWSVEELDEYEEGCLEFDGNTLTGYDGVFELPEQITDYLEVLGYKIDL